MKNQPSSPSPHPPRFMREPEMLKTTGLGRSTARSLIQQGKFPPPVKISARASAWVESEVLDYMARRIAARDAKA